MANPYAGDAGALRALSEGVCDVAFLRASTYDQYCSPVGNTPASWCLPASSFLRLPQLGQSDFASLPGSSFMSRRNGFSVDLRAKVVTTLEDLT